MIDFNKVSDSVISAFNNYMNDLDTFFLILSSEYGVRLYPKESIIIFDEIQQFPKARQAIKYLVADGRFDYIETGSLISIKENVMILPFLLKKGHYLCTPWTLRSLLGL